MRKILASMGMPMAATQTFAAILPPGHSYATGLIRLYALVKGARWGDLCGIGDPLDDLRKLTRAAAQAHLCGATSNPDGARFMMNWNTFERLVTTEGNRSRWLPRNHVGSDHWTQRTFFNAMLENDDFPRISNSMGGDWLPDGVVLLAVCQSNVWDVPIPNIFPANLRGVAALIVE